MSPSWLENPTIFLQLTIGTILLQNIDLFWRMLNLSWNKSIFRYLGRIPDIALFFFFLQKHYYILLLVIMKMLMCLGPQTSIFKQELIILFKSKKSDSPETWASLTVLHPLYRTWASVIVSLKVSAVSLRNWSKDNRSDSGKYYRQSRQSTNFFFFFQKSMPLDKKKLSGWVLVNATQLWETG